MIIRAARRDELDHLGIFYHDIWHETQAPFQNPGIVEFRDLAFMQQQMLGFFPDTLIASEDNCTLGFVVAHDDRLSQLFVSPDARGKSLGKQLLEIAETKLIAEGTRRATLFCLKGNDRARSFYERHGWTFSKDLSKQGDTPTGQAEIKAWELAREL